MKFSSALLVPAAILLGLGQANAQNDVAINVNTTEAVAVAATTTTTATATNAKEASILAACTQPDNAVTSGWRYNAWNDGPYWCTNKGDSIKWSMLRAYRSGGQEGTHWTYVDGGDQSRCMTNWGYYSDDGKTLKATIARATKMGDNRLWCALPVYRPGGVQGKQWQYCDCPRPPRPDPTPF